jgi:sarcosine oxidase
MSQVYDVIVIGVGGMGSATCYQLAKRGQRVLGLERFDIPHSMGSSHGDTRMLRLAYFEGQAYVPLVLRAHQLWQEIGKLAGEHLLHMTGTLDISGPDEEDIIGKAEQACRTYDLPYELLDSEAIMARYPGFKLEAKHKGLFQPDGGFVASEKAILAHTALAIDAGAEIRPRERVLGWEPTQSGGVKVKTERGTYEAGSLVLSTGPWIGEFAPGVIPFTQPYRQVFGWFRPRSPDLFKMGSFPSFTLKIDEGHYYGFPLWNNPGLKIGGPHHGREKCDPETLIRENRPSDEEGLRVCLSRYIPEALGAALSVRVCIYTMTPDEDFIIDRMPGMPQVVVASPCSGHGFKFASVFGEVLADLAMDRTPAFNLEPFALSRFASHG